MDEEGEYKFGIIVPTLGRASLAATLESIEAQTYKNFVVMLSCDVDYNFSQLVPEALEKKMVVLEHGESHAPDKGAFARNYAIKFLPDDVDYIVYGDDDDVWHPNRLAIFHDEILKLTDTHAARPDLIYSWGELWKYGHKHPRSSKLIPKRIGIVQNVTCGGLCHTKDLFLKTNGWNPKNLEWHDLELYNAMREHAEFKTLVITTPTFNYFK